MGANQRIDILLQVGEIFVEFEVEEALSVLLFGLGESAGHGDGYCAVLDADRALYCGKIECQLVSIRDDDAHLAAQRELQLRGGNPKASFVTVAINRVEFKHPVLVGDVVRFQTSVVRIGRTSITVRIDVHAERGAETIHVTEAEGVFVGVDLSTPDRKPVPLFPSSDPA